MSVVRYDINACIGCKLCFEICPFDVFRFNKELRKSVIAYPENCITCGQCYVNCPGHSLALSNEAYGHNITSNRSASLVRTNKRLFTPDGPNNTDLVIKR